MKHEPLKGKIKKMRELVEMVTVDTLGKCRKCGKKEWIDLQLGICTKCFLEIVKEKEFVWIENLKSAVQGLIENVNRCIEWAKCQDNLSREDMLEQLKEDIETEIKKWFADVVEDDRQNF